jgi:hypothetical protein
LDPAIISNGRYLTKDRCQHFIGQTGMPSIEKEEAVAEINFRNNSGTARKQNFTEGRFSP